MLESKISQQVCRNPFLKTDTPKAYAGIFQNGQGDDAYGTITLLGFN